MFKFSSHRSFIPFIYTLAVLFSGCSVQKDAVEAKKPKGFSLPVELGKVVRMDVKDHVRTVGTVLEVKRVFLSAEVDGKIIEISAKEGMHVKEGDVLAKIDPENYQLEVERLQHRLDSASKELEIAEMGLRPEEQKKLKTREDAAQSSLDLALIKRKRIERLVKDGVMAQSSLDNIIDEVLRAEERLKARQSSRKAGLQAREEDIAKRIAEVEAIKKQYDQTLLNLSKTSIRASFDGVVINKLVEQGTFVKRGTPVTEMVSSQGLKAVMTLPQGYREKLNKLESIEIFIKEIGAKIFIDKKHAKRIQVIPDANIYSGNINFWIDLDGKDSNLFPGLTFEAQLFMGKRRNVLHVPATALVISEQGTAVYIVKEGKAHIVPVQAFKERNGFVEVRDFTRQLSSKVDLILRGSGAVFPQATVMAVDVN